MVYSDAFANLYGITPLYRAFRIIQKQNPELKLTSEPQMIISDVERLAGRGRFHSLEQLNEFFQYYFAVYNSTRAPPIGASHLFRSEKCQ